MRTLGTLDSVSALLSRQAQGCRALGAIAEDVDVGVLIVGLCFGRGVEGKDPFDRSAKAQKPLVLTATLVYIFG